VDLRGGRGRRTVEPVPRPLPAAPAPGQESVSVVIPVRDDAEALDACLQALAGQTVRPLEVVVVDNGSTDDTARVAARHGARVVVEPRPGIPAAAAAGYDAAVGDVIARLDADSVPGPRWVERIATRMADEPDLDALSGTGRFTDLHPVPGALATAVYLGAYYVLGHLALGHPPLWGSSMAVRRSVWHEVRDAVARRDAEVHDDLDLAFALGPERRIVVDRHLRVGVSARSLRGAAQMRRRFGRAGRTLRRNWLRLPPWRRWRLRLGR